MELIDESSRGDMMIDRTSKDNKLIAHIRDITENYGPFLKLKEIEDDVTKKATYSMNLLDEIRICLQRKEVQV